jgi:ankyrin repeat protein
LPFFFSNDVFFFRFVVGPAGSARDIWYAASVGDIQTVRQCLEGDGGRTKAVLVNAVDAAGNTALHWAAYRNHPQLVEFLLSMGANPNVENNTDGQTPLHWACVSGNVLCAKTLLNEGMSGNNV